MPVRGMLAEAIQDKEFSDQAIASIYWAYPVLSENHIRT
jgi:hypothetical protein